MFCFEFLRYDGRIVVAKEVKKMKKKLTVLMIMAAAVMTLFACSGKEETVDAGFGKILESHGYQVMENTGEEEAGLGLMDGLGDDAEAKKEKKKLKEIQSLIKNQSVYENPELDEKTGFVNLVYVIETASPEDAEKLLAHYDSQYRQMEGCRVKKKNGVTSYINYEDMYYLKVQDSFLIKGQCNVKAEADTMKMLEEMNKAG